MGRKESRAAHIAALYKKADECRGKIIETVSENGGHLSANLGAVELTVALLDVFDPFKDRILFDVGHQCYTYKLLTGREDEFSTLRKKDGLSGFPNPKESAADAFTMGHAGNSIGIALGLCKARDALGEDYCVVDIIGDGAIANGMALEALAAGNVKPEKLIVILNDNGMSITKNDTGLYRAISKLTARSGYKRFKRRVKKVTGDSRFLASVKDFFKRALNKNNMFDQWGLKYVGPVDGHNISELERTLKNVKSYGQPVLLHVLTEKGKGFCEGEENSAKFHGIGRNLKCAENTFSDAVSEIMERQLERDGRTVAVTAAMRDGTGLREFSEKHPDNFIDAGIAEGYAATVASGMAKGGLRPFVFIYSTFLQRAYDQLVEEAALENLPVVFMTDRAGLTGADGYTHQGIFDIAFANSIPNFTVLEPKDAIELEECVRYAASLAAPVLIRYPNGECETFGNHTEITAETQWETVKEGDGGTVILAVGNRMLNLALKAAEGSTATVVNCRVIKPLDKKYLDGIKAEKIITLEDGVISGGFGSQVASYVSAFDAPIKVKPFGVPNIFVPHATVLEQFEACGLTVERVRAEINR